MSETNTNAMVLSPFLGELVAQLRANDAYGSLSRFSDEKLLEPYILDKEKRKKIPIIGDPSPVVIRRVEMFYNAVALAVEKRCGTMVSTMLSLHHEGFGRLVLIAGNLVVYSKHLRDVHRYGFPSLESLSQEGMKCVDDCISMLNTFPAAAGRTTDKQEHV